MITIAMTLVALAAPGGCNSQACERRVERKRRAKVVRPYNTKLLRMRRCEWDPRQRWKTNTGNGYYGAFQFDMRTWRSVGGWSRPDLNSPLNQKYRAVLLIKRRGYSPWPNCGRM